MTLECFVINLKKDTERLAHMSKEFSNLGLKFNVFNATYGKDLPEDFIEQCRQDDELLFNLKGNVKVKLLGKLTVNEIGCALSHLRLYQHIIDSGLDKALIVEDDISLDSKLKLALENLDKIPESWDVVNFSIHKGMKDLWCSKKYYFADGMYFKRAGLHNSYLNARFNARRIIGTTACYVVTKEACQKLINLGYPIRMPSDFLLGMLAFNHLKTFRAHPIGDYIKDLNTESSIGRRSSNILVRV